MSASRSQISNARAELNVKTCINHPMWTEHQPVQSHAPVLVINADGSAAKHLAGQIRRRGFEADVATSCWATRAAIRKKRYGTLIVVANFNLAADRECLSRLRTKLTRVWFIVISSYAVQDSYGVALRATADSLLAAPFAIEDLLFRLSAFAHRSRPP